MKRCADGDVPLIGVVVCEQFPEGIPDDRPLLAALSARAEVLLVDWRDEEQLTGLQQADAVVVRSPWDYIHHPEDFGAWLGLLEQMPRVINPVEGRRRMMMMRRGWDDG